MHLAFLTKPGRIEQHKVKTKFVEAGIYRIARSASDVRNNVAFLVKKRIYNGRFSSIRTTYDSHLWKVLKIVHRIFIHVLGEFIQEVTSSPSIYRRDGMVFFNPKAVEFRSL